jgi:group I intron endonuclease
MSVYSIYKITNIINKKVYIGFTSKSIDNRFNTHIDRITNPKTALNYAMVKYGVNNFTIEAIYQSLDKQHTKNVMESHFITEYQSHVDNGQGYNMSYGGDGVINPCQLTRYKQGSANRGKKLGPRSVTTKKLIGLANSKKARTQAEKDHLRKINTGKKQSANTKLKHSKEWLVVSPNGDQQRLHNLTQFCRDNNLNQGAMASVGRGTKPSYKGWSCTLL